MRLFLPLKDECVVIVTPLVATPRVFITVSDFWLGEAEETAAALSSLLATLTSLPSSFLFFSSPPLCHAGTTWAFTHHSLNYSWGGGERKKKRRRGRKMKRGVEGGGMRAEESRWTWLSSRRSILSTPSKLNFSPPNFFCSPLILSIFSSLLTSLSLPCPLLSTHPSHLLFSSLQAPGRSSLVSFL